MTTVERTYLSRIAERAPTASRLAFRGHADSNWELHSGATRRLLAEAPAPANNRNDGIPSSAFAHRYILYHRAVLLEPARTYGFDASDGSHDSDLHLLSKLQHFGAATGLIDFSWDSLVALWFATHDPDRRKCSGRVIAINLNDTIHFARVPNEPDNQTLERIFPLDDNATTRQLFWEPRFRGEAGRRVLRQRSVFLVGNPAILEVSPGRIEFEIEIDSMEDLAKPWSVDNEVADVRANRPSW